MKKEGSISAAWRALLLSGSGFALFLSLALTAHSQTPVESSLPEGKGKELVESVCAQCHGLRETISLRKTAEEWRAIVNDMVSQGTPLLDDEIDVVAEYLAKNFGPGKNTATAPAASDPVNVNKATAKDLETVLGISEKDAAEIIQYREKNGNFGKWEDLKKVPGLDAAKIEEKKARLSF
ncbi:MAG: helix-hairpin-helix domain-containing protein [Acidobacteria bacterium]|nr:helix-hairpin-helix domain-containing protein [Acidobacteriota bacterium]